MWASRGQNAYLTGVRLCLKRTRSMAGTHSWPQGSRQGLDLLPESEPSHLMTCPRNSPTLPPRLSPSAPRSPQLRHFLFPLCPALSLRAPRPFPRIPALTWLHPWLTARRPCCFSGPDAWSVRHVAPPATPTKRHWVGKGGLKSEGL